MEGPKIDLAFQIYYEDTVTPLNFESGKAITEFKDFCLWLEFKTFEVVLFLESFARLNVEDLLEFSLSSLIELKSKKGYSYKLYCINKTKIVQLIKHKSFCTQKVFAI